jgi:hypothetical protein
MTGSGDRGDKNNKDNNNNNKVRINKRTLILSTLILVSLSVILVSSGPISYLMTNNTTMRAAAQSSPSSATNTREPSSSPSSSAPSSSGSSSTSPTSPSSSRAPTSTPPKSSSPSSTLSTQSSLNPNSPTSSSPSSSSPTSTTSSPTSTTSPSPSSTTPSADAEAAAKKTKKPPPPAFCQNHPTDPRCCPSGSHYCSAEKRCASDLTALCDPACTTADPCGDKCITPPQNVGGVDCGNGQCVKLGTDANCADCGDNCGDPTKHAPGTACTTGSVHECHCTDPDQEEALVNGQLKCVTQCAEGATRDSSGACHCGTNEQVCGADPANHDPGTCTDTTKDGNCGACGVTCSNVITAPGGQPTCNNGVCQACPVGAVYVSCPLPNGDFCHHCAFGGQIGCGPGPNPCG